VMVPVQVVVSEVQANEKRRVKDEKKQIVWRFKLAILMRSYSVGVRSVLRPEDRWWY
jgi:hypothetical protein